MCGIAGLATIEHKIDETVLNQVDKMLEANPWRGPDAKGVCHNQSLILGHNRLSIIDLSTAANQPMMDIYGNAIVFNGEIYNYRELKGQLSSIYEFKTSSDTEVILAAYSKWGQDCVNRFNGEWAFAIYDYKLNSLIISRDRFGIKPLYYTKDDIFFYFASEIRSLLAAGVPAKISIKKIAEFLKFRQIENRYETIFDGIYPLEPGKNLIIDLNTGKIQEWNFYTEADLFSADIPSNEREASEFFGALLQDAVKKRLHADVPVQILLSGGLDSSAISALAVNSSGRSVKTLSHVFPGNPNDESCYSDLVAEYLGTDHSRVTSESIKFFEIFDEVILAQDFPTYSEKHVARYLLYKKAAEQAKVILEGQGGDEVFGGYGRLYQIFRDNYQDDLGIELLMEAPQKKPKSALPHFAELQPEIRKPLGKITKNIDSIKTDDPYKKRQFSILRNNLLSLLHTGDRLQMYNSIEGRYPFLDHRVVECGMSMPVRFKMREYDKYLLRVFLERNKLLPNAVTRRTDKKGFSTDLEDFLLKSQDVRSHLYENFAHGVRNFPGLFDMSAFKQLLAEQYDHGINNTRRLLASYSLMKYLADNNVSITDTK